MATANPTQLFEKVSDEQALIRNARDWGQWTGWGGWEEWGAWEGGTRTRNRNRHRNRQPDRQPERQPCEKDVILILIPQESNANGGVPEDECHNTYAIF